MGFVLDVAGYGGRGVPERDGVQDRLRQLVVAMLAACALTLESRGVDHQWTGDGVNLALPAGIDPTVVLTMAIRSLAAGLHADNAGHADQIRLRMAVGVGLIERSAAGFGGPVIVEINRLVDSAALRAALNREPAAELAVAISDQAHALIIQPGYPGIPGGQFTRVDVAAKEFTGAAWIWLSSRQWSEPAYQPLTVSDPREAGRYRLVARLGTGRGSQVYLASGGDSGWAAVKVFGPRLSADPDVRRRLSIGARAASVVRQPHLAPVVDFDVAARQEQPWVASMLVRGPSLGAVVAETGALPATAAGWVALALADTLATLHAAGLSHRAVSPYNVLLAAAGPLLTDFGLSRRALISGPSQTGAGDERADDVLWLGATTFYAVTGRPVWGERPADTDAVLPPAADRPAATELAGSPLWLTRIVLACLAPDPTARPAAAQVRGWLAGEAGPQPRSWLPDPVASRVAEYQVLPESRGRFRWSRGRELARLAGGNAAVIRLRSRWPVGRLGPC